MITDDTPANRNVVSVILTLIMMAMTMYCHIICMVDRSNYLSARCTFCVENETCKVPAADGEVGRLD